MKPKKFMAWILIFTMIIGTFAGAAYADATKEEAFAGPPPGTATSSNASDPGKATPSDAALNPFALRASGRGIAMLLTMSYFQRGNKRYDLKETAGTGEHAAKNYEFNLYTDFSDEDTYMPTSVEAADGSDAYYAKLGSFDDPSYWSGGYSQTIPEMFSAEEGYPLTQADMQESRIRMNRVRPNEKQLTITEFEGCYDKNLDEEYMASTIYMDIGLDKDGALSLQGQPDKDALASMKQLLDQNFDRVFLAAEDGSGHEWPYQMKTLGHWVPVSAGESDEFPQPGEKKVKPGTYRFSVDEELTKRHNKGDGFDWSDVGVNANVSYFVSDYGMKSNIANVSYHEDTAASLVIGDLIGLLPESTNASFFSGYGQDGYVYEKEMKPVWILDPEYYTDPEKTMGESAKFGERYYFEMDFFGDDYQDMVGVEHPKMTIVLNPKEDDNYEDGDDEEDANDKEDAAEEGDNGNEDTSASVKWDDKNYKYITKYHVDDIWVYTFEAGQTFGEAGLPEKVLVDYYTSQGESGSEWVTLDWINDDYMTPGASDPIDDYYNTPADAIGDHVILWGWAPDLNVEWRHAPGVGPAKMSFQRNSGRTWLEIDIQNYDYLNMTLDGDNLSVESRRNYERQYEIITPGGKKTIWSFRDYSERYDMSEYGGIRLYSSQEEYPLKQDGNVGTLLTVKDAVANLFLDDVEIRTEQLNGMGAPLINIVSSKDGPLVPPNTTDEEPPNIADFRTRPQGFTIDSRAEKYVGAALFVHVRGKCRLENIYTGGEAIRVPFNTLVAVNGVGSEPDLTAISGNQGAAIGGGNSTGGIFIHNVLLNLGINGKWSTSSERFGILGSQYTDEVPNGPIIISGGAVVTPLPNGVDDRFDMPPTVGKMSLSPDNHLEVVDGAVLKTFSSFLPPAYSVFNTSERPYRNSQIVFNYMSDEEHTVTFDASGRCLVDTEVSFKEKSRNKEVLELEVTTRLKGMYPVYSILESEFENIDGIAQFGPFMLEGPYRDKNNITCMLSMNPDTESGKPLVYEDKQTILVNRSFGDYNFISKAEKSNMFYMEPKAVIYSEEEKGQLLTYQFAYQNNIDFADESQVEQSPVAGPGNQKAFIENVALISRIAEDDLTNGNGELYAGLAALEVNFNDQDATLTVEQMNTLGEGIYEAYAKLEKEVLNGALRDDTDGLSEVQIWQFVDRLAPTYTEFTEEYLPHYLWADVSRSVGSGERITSEFVPITWREEVLDGQRYTAGTVNGRPGVNRGSYRFVAELPEEYTYTYGVTAAPEARVTVLESQHSRRENWSIRKAFELANETGKPGGPASSGSYHVPEDAEIKIELHFEEERDTGGDFDGAKADERLKQDEIIGIEDFTAGNLDTMTVDGKSPRFTPKEFFINIFEYFFGFGR